jgi:endoglycosylceramidase
MLAGRYLDNRAVIGYDLMNEPFMGSGVSQVMPAMLQAYAGLLVAEGQDPPPSMEEMAEMWSTEEARNKVYEKLSDPEKFSVIADALYAVQAPFEKEVLMPFYQECRDAIREVDSNHIIFIEHAIFANSGALTGIQPLLKENGERDPLVAYAPHGYDLVTDTGNQAASSLERVRFIFDRINQNADRLDMPVLVGEWGAFYGAEDPAVVEQAEFILDQYDKHGFSHTYWSYFDGLEKMPYFEALQNR